MVDIYNGDCLEVLRYYPNDYFSAVVTDCPYEWAIFNSHWDNTGVSFREDTWLEMLRVLKPGAFLISFAGGKTYHRIASSIEDAGFNIEEMLVWVYAQGNPKQNNRLKPATEPIILAKKPGVGELNIQACRFPVRGIAKPKFPEGDYSTDSAVGAIRSVKRVADADPNTRYPSTFIISDDELVEDNKGSYFFCAKPTAAERGGIEAKTLKPLRLMRWLCRLVAKPGDVILDPFMGSATTGIAALEQGIDFVGIELRKRQFEEARKRIKDWYNKPTVDLNDPMEVIKKKFEDMYG